MIEWFEDLSLGMKFETGRAEISEADIKRFASEFDPQPFHLDNEAAQKSVFKGLAASGWHTAALGMRLAVESKPFGPHPMVGLGVEDLRWLAPIRGGDVLRMTGEVIELITSKSKPQGIAKIKWTMVNQASAEVYTFTPNCLVPGRPKAA